MWFHQKDFDTKKPKREETSDRQLDPEEYEVYVNPRLVAETDVRIKYHNFLQEKEFQWEHCPSFPGIRCMVKRPLGIRVSYLDYDGDEHENHLYEHYARVFLHELDHINGKTMTHWKLSEGNIDIISGGQQDHYKNLASVSIFNI